MKRVVVTAMLCALSLIGVAKHRSDKKQTPVVLQAQRVEILSVLPELPSDHAKIPTLPARVDFAGEQVSLEWPDVRQMLEREMVVNIYGHSRTLQTLRAVPRYFDIIEPILAEQGVPDDLKYLCVAESGLNPEAMSPARAAGLWQFIEPTARSYGLECGPEVDMRYSLEQSTRAACAFLKKLYARFGSWTLAAAAYNVGEAGLARRIEAQGVGDYHNLFLPEETMRYVHRIVAWKVILGDPKRYGFDLKKRDYLSPFSNYRRIDVSGERIDWSKLAIEHGTNYRMLRLLNPWIRAYTYHNKDMKTYQVWMPTVAFRQAGY